MSKILKYEGIGCESATFAVDATTVAYLKANYMNNSSERVDVNGKNLAVKLTGDNTVGFGASTPTDADAVFGIIETYEEDGYATVIYKGFIEDVAVKAAMALGSKNVVVNDKGEMSLVSGASSRAMVTKAATSSDLAVNMYIG